MKTRHSASCECLAPCRLEAEIKEAQLRAKQEMLHSLQIAREVAQQELSSQKAAYEGRIEALQAELVSGRAGPPFSAVGPGTLAVEW